MLLGDIVQVEADSTVPADVVGKFCRVVGLDGGRAVLSLPYRDAKLTMPYLPPGISNRQKRELLNEFARRGQGVNWRG